MKAGIFIPGLGEAFPGTTIKGYAQRLANEMDYANPVQLKFYTTEERFEYAGNCTTDCITIWSKNGDVEKREYRLYDFSYARTLTKNYEEQSVVTRCLLIFKTIILKSPILFKRLFKANVWGYQSKRLRLLSFYTFGIFLVMALAGISLIPAAITLIEEIFDNKALHDALANHKEITEFAVVSKKLILGFTSFILLGLSFFPSVQKSIGGFATEFCCVDNYLELGKRRQALIGDLNALVEFIAEKETAELPNNEAEFKLHFHAYSFGSILALDLLYPFGSPPVSRIAQLTECLITVGCPYEYIQSYYPVYFKNRDTKTVSLKKWYNVLSVADALSSNFRNDAQPSPAQYSFSEVGPIAENIQYEVSPADPSGIWNFLSLYSLKAHQFYWDESAGGQSCLKDIYTRLAQDKLLS